MIYELLQGCVKDLEGKWLDFDTAAHDFVTVLTQANLLTEANAVGGLESIATNIANILLRQLPTIAPTPPPPGTPGTQIQAVIGTVGVILFDNMTEVKTAKG